jgi:hypothetical protein
MIVADLQTTLKPFMLVQKLLEGQSCVTMSFIPYLIYKVRKNVASLFDNPTSSHHVHCNSRKMLEKLDEIFGSGIEGTVAAADHQEGP